MRYLIRKKKSRTYHLFQNGDTLCRMYSTGGLVQRRYRISDTPEGVAMCQLCKKVLGDTVIEEVFIQPKVAGNEFRKRQLELARLVAEQKADIRSVRGGR